MKLLKVAVAMIAAACALDALAAFERTVDNVVALTNALTELSALDSNGKTGARVWLQPGIYNLSGVYMSATHHLDIPSCSGGLVAGLGEGPEDTILLGGGEAEAHGVVKMGGGSNWSFNTISNLTVTGGDTSSAGGGISGASSLEYRNLIVSNNVARTSNNGSGGGGCSLGRAFGCLFANNRTTQRWGGGFVVSGRSNRNENEGQGAWNCVFVGNFAAQNGGGLAIDGGGQCHDCCFTNNTASSGGGGVYVQQVDYATFNGTPLKSKIIGCSFAGNRGKGAGFLAASLVFVSNCVFAANSGSSTAVLGDIKDSKFESNTNTEGIVCNSSMERCMVKDNVVPNRYATGIDYCEDGAAIRTNVNCLIVLNGFASEYGKILYRKACVNCTVLDNYMPSGGNFGHLSRQCIFWNCVLSGNRIGTTTYRDVRTTASGVAVAVAMTNCVFSTSDISAGETAADGTVSHEGVSNCRKIAAANLKFVDASNGDYTPTTRSPLYGTGCADDWILSLVGDKDLAGNQRMFGGGLDIGAYEGQLNKPGAMLIVW